MKCTHTSLERAEAATDELCPLCLQAELKRTRPVRGPTPAQGNLMGELTLLLKEAAAETGIHYQTLRDRAKAGQITGASKPGKRWVFLRSGLVAYLESLSPCRSTVSGQSITSIYRPAADDFDALLGLPTRRKRMNITKNSGANCGDKNG